MEHAPKVILAALSLTSTSLFALGGLNAGLTLPLYIGLTGVGLHYAW